MISVIADFLWISDITFLYYALLLWLVLSVIDNFYNTDAICWVILLVIASWATYHCCSSILWGILFFLVILALLIALHVVARNYMHKFFNKILTKNAPQEYTDTLSGSPGVIVGTGDNVCVRVEEVLYPLPPKDRPLFKEGENVVFVGLESGMAIVKKA